MAKYNKEIVQRICNYIRDGDTQKVAAERAGIREGTFYEWMNTKDEFSEAVKKAHEDFHETIVAKLEATLYRKAQGYEVTETDTEYINGKDGKPIIKSQKKKIKHIQPDTGALIFALTNLTPDKWKNKRDVDYTDTKNEDDAKKYNLAVIPQEDIIALANKMQDARYDEETKE